MQTQGNRIRIHTIQHQKPVLRRVLFLTSSVVVLLFLGLFLCINFAENNSATAASASSKSRLVNH